MEEPWHTAEFPAMSRRQQNCEIYRVVSSAVLGMAGEVEVARARLAHLLDRFVNIEINMYIKLHTLGEMRTWA